MSGNDAALSAEDRLLAAVARKNANANAQTEAVHQAIRDGANVNAVYCDRTPLSLAAERGFDEIIRILLDAGADARWKNKYGMSAILFACLYGHLSTVQLLIHHDSDLLDIVDKDGYTPLIYAVSERHSDIARFLLDRGADARHVSRSGETPLMYACQFGNLEIVRLLMAAGVDLEARDESRRTALHYALEYDRREVVRELILQHNAYMFAEDYVRKPFDMASHWLGCDADIDRLLEIYGNKLLQDHGSLAFHELLKVAEYSFAFAKERRFHPPLNPLRIILPLGKLTLKHLRTLLHSLDPELICTREDSGKLPIHIACQKKTPVEVLALILELDPATLHVADSTGALPIHCLCGAPVANKYASVRCLVEQGGVGTLAARNRQGLLPLHVLCRSKNLPLRAVQYLIQSFPGSVAVQTNAGQYPFMMAAAAKPYPASLSVIYKLVRASPGLVIQR